MRNRFFGMLATIMMGGAVMTGLTAFAGTYQERQADHDHRQEPEGHGQQHRDDCQQPDHECADYRQPDRRRHSDHLL